jgi:hypothetical protein
VLVFVLSTRTRKAGSALSHERNGRGRAGAPSAKGPLSHRVLRVRWPAQCGIPLSVVRMLLAFSPHPPPEARFIGLATIAASWRIVTASRLSPRLDLCSGCRGLAGGVLEGTHAIDGGGNVGVRCTPVRLGFVEALLQDGGGAMLSCPNLVGRQRYRTASTWRDG